MTLTDKAFKEIMKGQHVHGQRETEESATLAVTVDDVDPYDMKRCVL